MSITPYKKKDLMQNETHKYQTGGKPQDKGKLKDPKNIHVQKLNSQKLQENNQLKDFCFESHIV